MIEVGFCMLPEPGHVLPSLPVARRMQLMGYRVSYLCPAALLDYFRQRGFGVHPILKNVLRTVAQESLLQATQNASWYRSLSHYLAANRVDFGELLASELRDLPLDMLVCDGSIARAWGATLAAGFHKPIAALSVILPDSETDRPMSIPEIVLCPQEFDLPHDRFRSLSSRAPIFYAEPSVCREGTLRGSCAISGMSKEPVIYCTFGTQTYRYANAAAIFNCVIDACIGLPCQVIVSCNDPAALNYGAAYPTNVTVVPSAPQMAILEQARLFISHGGLGGVKESIMNGVPLLVIPFDMDQPRNAERVLYHGLGAICGPSDCTATRLRELIDHVLGDSETPLRVRRMSTIFREREQEASAARIVAGCLLGCDAPTASSERVGS